MIYNKCVCVCMLCKIAQANMKIKLILLNAKDQSLSELKFITI